MKNGVPVSMDVEFVSLNKQVARIVDGTLKAVGEGEADIQVILKDCTDIEPEELLIHITVSAAESEVSYYIDGKDELRLGRDNYYSLRSTSNEVVQDVEFSIDHLEYAKFAIKENDKTIILKDATSYIGNPCIVHGNENNQLKKFILTATINGQSYTKTI